MRTAFNRRQQFWSLLYSKKIDEDTRTRVCFNHLYRYNKHLTHLYTHGLARQLDTRECGEEVMPIGDNGMLGGVVGVGVKIEIHGGDGGEGDGVNFGGRGEVGSLNGLFASQSHGEGEQ